jgi:hypothetical protein
MREQANFDTREQAANMRGQASFDTRVSATNMQGQASFDMREQASLNTREQASHKPVFADTRVKLNMCLAAAHTQARLKAPRFASFRTLCTAVREAD